MKRKILCIFWLLLSQAYGQDLFSERIRKISHDKKAVFLDNGIFHNGPSSAASAFKGLRHHYSKELGYERLVFDFASETIPRLYAYLNGVENKLYIDFFKTEMKGKPVSTDKSVFVEEINVFLVEKGNVSTEIVFKQNAGIEIFYLDYPGRLVIDIKGR